jgi:predicted metalloprotease
MCRWLLVIALAITCLIVPQQAAAQSTIELVVGDLDSFWAGQFANLGVAYASPVLHAIDSPVDTECGVLDPWLSPGAFCAANDTVYYSLAWAPSSPEGEILWWTVLSHEWGHHVQALADTGVQSVLDAELQADCFAGAYLQHARDIGLVSPDAVSEALSLTQSAGDVWFFLPEDAPEHGNKAERALAFMSGMNGGVSACGLGG